jgi:hypothetical protein
MVLTYTYWEGLWGIRKTESCPLMLTMTDHRWPRPTPSLASGVELATDGVHLFLGSLGSFGPTAPNMALWF